MGYIKQICEMFCRHKITILKTSLVNCFNLFSFNKTYIYGHLSSSFFVSAQTAIIRQNISNVNSYCEQHINILTSNNKTNITKPLMSVAH